MGTIAQQQIHLGEDLDGVDKIRLWWLAPLFKDLKQCCRQLDGEFAVLSDIKAYAIIWMKPAWLGSRLFKQPELDKWMPRTVILSGAGNDVSLGVILTKHVDEEDPFLWRRFKNIWSLKSGSKSSATCKWILTRLKEGAVCDPYARDPTLATWCRRLNIGYHGYTKNKAIRRQIETALAQTELPGIQVDLPLLMEEKEENNGT